MNTTGLETNTQKMDRLEAELERLKAENRRLGYAPSLMLLYLNQMAERFVKQEGRIGPHDVAVYEQGIGMERAWKELREKFAPFESLDNLLAPTIELLTIIRRHLLGAEPGTISLKAVEDGIARLRGIVEME